MNTEKQRSFIIQIIYFSILLSLFYIFFQYVLPAFFPVFAGFFIAYMMRPLIRKLHQSLGIHEKILSIFCILFFYTVLFTVLFLCLWKAYHYIKIYLEPFSQWYQSTLAPYFEQHTTQSVSLLSSSFDLSTFLSAIQNAFYSSFTSFLSSLIQSILNFLQNFFSQLPKFLLSFFITIFSSFLFQMDYPRITAFLIKQIPQNTRNVVLASSTFLKKSILHMIKANLILSFIVFIELLFIFHFLNLNNIFLLAFFICLFDALPVFGCGMILLPWILFCILNGQKKLAVGLLICYLLTTLTKNLLEPKIMGKQMGIHPVILLLCMYIGGKLFGFLGFLFLPNIIMIIRCLKEEGYLSIYK